MLTGNRKFDCEIEEFENAFYDKKNAKIAIYGTGRMTATLLAAQTDFKIIGLLDRDINLVGKSLYGIKIIDKETAEKEADIVVINTAETYWDAIYKRIQDWKVPVYLRNGKRASEALIQNNDDNIYWDQSYKILQEKVEEYEVISFDIFDTLLMRKVLLPEDMFSLVEYKLERKYKKRINFLEQRRRAAAEQAEQTLGEIYCRIQKISGWTEHLVQEIKECEIQTDRELMVSREDMVQLCRKVMSQKEVYFISDMYYSSTYLQLILKDMGIQTSIDHIIVSCEQGKSKSDGGLWGYYKEKVIGNRKALHIGDNEKSDKEEPEKYGISAYLVWSGTKMLENSSIRSIVPRTTGLFESILVGMIAARICNSPFALNPTKGMVSFEDLQTAGYCLLGGVIYSFLDFLLKKAKEHKVDEIVFFARDGYILVDLYRFFCHLLPDMQMPSSKYLEISRRAISVPAIDTEKDIWEYSMLEPFAGNFEGFMQNRFNVKTRHDDSELDMSEIYQSRSRAQGLLKKYKDEIWKEIKQEKKNYVKYWEGLKVKENFAIVDLLLNGRIQFYLGKLLKKRLKGYYFCTRLETSNPYAEYNDMYGCFQKENDETGKDNMVWKYKQFMESFFTAPYGMLQFINDELKPVYYPPKSNQSHFQIREEMVQGIKTFLQDIIAIQGKSDEILSATPLFADALMGCFLQNGFIPSPQMKQGMFFDNDVYNAAESPIWE